MEMPLTQALGLPAPWRVANVNFSPGHGCIVFQIENTAGWLAQRAAQPTS
jgi:hypothetical protein